MHTITHPSQRRSFGRLWICMRSMREAHGCMSGLILLPFCILFCWCLLRSWWTNMRFPRIPLRHTSITITAITYEAIADKAIAEIQCPENNAVAYFCGFHEAYCKGLLRLAYCSRHTVSCRQASTAVTDSLGYTLHSMYVSFPYYYTNLHPIHN
jgi:hypothetical protein